MNHVHSKQKTRLRYSLSHKWMVTEYRKQLTHVISNWCWERPNMDRVPNPIGERVVPIIRTSTKPYLMKPQELRGPRWCGLVVLVRPRGTIIIKMAVFILLVRVITYSGNIRKTSRTKRIKMLRDHGVSLSTRNQ